MRCPMYFQAHVYWWLNLFQHLLRLLGTNGLNSADVPLNNKETKQNENERTNEHNLAEDSMDESKIYILNL